MGRWSTNERIITIVKVLHREWGSELYIMLPSPVVLSQEDEPLKCLALKASRAYIWETQRTVGNRESILKGCTQKFTGSGTLSRN